MRLRFLPLLLLACMALPAGLAQPSFAVDDTFFYCVLVDNVHSAVYFSNVFAGDIDNATTYEDSYHTHVRRLYPRAFGMASCTYTDTAAKARTDKEARKRRYSDVYRSFFETNWAY